MIKLVPEHASLELYSQLLMLDTQPWVSSGVRAHKPLWQCLPPRDARLPGVDLEGWHNSCPSSLEVAPEEGCCLGRGRGAVQFALKDAAQRLLDEANLASPFNSCPSWGYLTISAPKNIAWEGQLGCVTSAKPVQ